MMSDLKRFHVLRVDSESLQGWDIVGFLLNEGMSNTSALRCCEDSPEVYGSLS
jgi:hypothetical protein